MKVRKRRFLVWMDVNGRRGQQAAAGVGLIRVFWVGVGSGMGTGWQGKVGVGLLVG